VFAAVRRIVGGVAGDAGGRGRGGGPARAAREKAELVRRERTPVEQDVVQAAVQRVVALGAGLATDGLVGGELGSRVAEVHRHRAVLYAIDEELEQLAGGVVDRGHLMPGACR